MNQVIDFHAHLFNLRYLPVAGILRRYSNNKLPVTIALGVEWYLWRKTGSSYRDTIGEEIISANDTPNRIFDLLGLDTKPYNATDLLTMTGNELVEILAQQLNDEDVADTPLAIALDDFQRIETGQGVPTVNFSARVKSAPLTMEERTFALGIFRRLFYWAIELIDSALAGIDTAVKHLRWFILMMYSEEYLYRQLERENRGVTFYVHHMMDVDHFFIDEQTGRFYNSYYSFHPGQTQRMNRMHHSHQNELAGFVAFNPARADAMDVIKSALANGFRGVKFYPPLGYRAHEDDNILYRKQIAALIKFCVAGDVPLFTHCNNSGFQAFPLKNSGYQSNPVHWENLLLEPGNGKLRLCLGHGGGGEGWFAPNRNADHTRASDIKAADIKNPSSDQEYWNHSYAAMVFKLCILFPNVYCDFAYLDEMINEDGTIDQQKSGAFRERLVKLLKAEPAFSEKIIYGSDWHMLYREGKNAVYFQAYEAFFNHPDLQPYAENFFYNNGKRFMK
jgi:predicted TIM-barrel fold metal-dependent hydrolase